MYTPRAHQLQLLSVLCHVTERVKNKNKIENLNIYIQRLHILPLVVG